MKTIIEYLNEQAEKGQEYKEGDYQKYLDDNSSSEVEADKSNMPEYNNLEALVFRGHKLTPVINSQTNEPWFLGKEIKSILDLKNLSDAIKNAELEEDEFTIVLNDSGIGGSKMALLSESGLYGLIGNSRKQIGKDLRKFVRKEVLPSIRKNGSYKAELSTDEILDKFIEDRLKLKTEVKRLERTKAHIANKQVATAMNTASQARKSEIKALEALGLVGNYRQVKAIKWLGDFFILSSKSYIQIGRQLSKLSRENGYDVNKVDDISYGSINSYHTEIIDLFQQKLIDEDGYLSKYRRKISK